ncbi:hypothetical protein IAU60_003831 [Kwoniella sp. DSM 27419]
MLENIPGMTLSSDGSVCLTRWLVYFLIGTTTIITLILIILIVLSVREAVLMRRSRLVQEKEEDERLVLVRKAESLGIKAKDE